VNKMRTTIHTIPTGLDNRVQPQIGDSVGAPEASGRIVQAMLPRASATSLKARTPRFRAMFPRVRRAEWRS
jgi:hypothetical protein